MDDLTLRTTFDREAARYGRARPAPPKTLLDAMLKHLSSEARVLEVGCGTGQATLPLAQAGLQVHALELGPALAKLARVNLSGYPDVTVETVAFEDFHPDTPFDALVSVQAFHWIAPETGLMHAASLIRPGGALLLAWHQDCNADSPFNRAVDPIYNRYESPLELNRPTPSSSPDRFIRVLKDSPLFRDLHVSHYPWHEVYLKERYLELLLTHSNVQAMDPPVQEHFLAEIAKIIDRHGGQAERFYESVLVSARREYGVGASTSSP